VAEGGVYAAYFELLGGMKGDVCVSVSDFIPSIVAFRNNANRREAILLSVKEPAFPFLNVMHQHEVSSSCSGNAFFLILEYFHAMLYYHKKLLHFIVSNARFPQPDTILSSNNRRYNSQIPKVVAGGGGRPLCRVSDPQLLCLWTTSPGARALGLLVRHSSPRSDCPHA
jgi:hypothetical protein